MTIANEPKIAMKMEETGAVRSTDRVGERWDLMSGIALRQLRPYFGLRLMGYQAPELINISIEYAYRFLGGDSALMDTEPGWKSVNEPEGRIRLLLRAWWPLCVAIERIDNVGPTSDIEEDSFSAQGLPYYAMKSLAKTFAEGAEKYGEENWHNGFQVKGLLNNAIHHLIAWQNGFREENDLGHAMWGFMAAVHNIETRPNLQRLLLGTDYSITTELKSYHEEHISRRKLED